MTSLSALWMPVVVASILVFLMSSVVHMVSKWHANDYQQVPDEDKVMDALRPFAIPPGDYFLPRPASMQDMKSQAFIDKTNRGPRIVMTVMPNGMTSMGGNLFKWFIFIAVVSHMAGYVTSRALAPGAEYLKVFQIAGATAFAAYAFGMWPMSIWYQRSWSTTVKQTVDGLLYGAITAGAFGWLWPR